MKSQERVQLSESAEALAHAIMHEHQIAAARTISELCVYAESESVRLNASKFIIEFFEQRKAKGGSEWEELISELAKNDPA